MIDLWAAYKSRRHKHFGKGLTDDESVNNNNNDDKDVGKKK